MQSSISLRMYLSVLGTFTIITQGCPSSRVALRASSRTVYTATSWFLTFGLDRWPWKRKSGITGASSLISSSSIWELTTSAVSLRRLTHLPSGMLKCLATLLWNMGPKWRYLVFVGVSRKWGSTDRARLSRSDIWGLFDFPCTILSHIQLGLEIFQGNIPNSRAIHVEIERGLLTREKDGGRMFYLTYQIRSTGIIALFENT